MLLFQKAACEGSLALCLYGSRLVDEIEASGAADADRELLSALPPPTVHPNAARATRVARPWQRNPNASPARSAGSTS